MPVERQVRYRVSTRLHDGTRGVDTENVWNSKVAGGHESARTLEDCGPATYPQLRIPPMSVKVRNLDARSIGWPRGEIKSRIEGGPATGD